MVGETTRKDGRYQYVYKDCHGKKHYIYARTLELLREKEQQLQLDLLQGLDVSGSNIIFNDLFKLWFTDKRNIRSTTKVEYQKVWKNNIYNSKLGHMKIKNIKPRDIQFLYNELFDKGLKYHSVCLVNSLISSAFNYAYENDYILKQPQLGIMKKYNCFKSRDKKETMHLTPEQINNLLNHCSGSNTYRKYIPFIKIAIGTCCRIGELSGLTWNDIDMKNHIISINHTLNYTNLGKGCSYNISIPKTAASYRIIPMTDFVYDALLELSNNHTDSSNAYCVDGYSDFVFLTANNTPYSAHRVNQILKNLENSYNKAHPNNPLPHMSAHMLRHTGCSLLVNSNMNIATVQAIMGHSTPNITLAIYTHTTIEDTKNEMKRLNLIK